MKKRYETPDDFYEQYGVHVDDLPEFTDEDFQRMYDVFAVAYRKVCEDENLDAIEGLWELAEDNPELCRVIRRVHEDQTFGQESMLEKYMH